MQQTAENPMTFGRIEEPEIVGNCEGCGSTLCAVGGYKKWDDRLFCDESCFCEFMELEDAI
jgi:hypothetical protein